MVGPSRVERCDRSRVTERMGHPPRRSTAHAPQGFRSISDGQGVAPPNRGVAAVTNPSYSDVSWKKIIDPHSIALHVTASAVFGRLSLLKKYKS